MNYEYDNEDRVSILPSLATKFIWFWKIRHVRIKILMKEQADVLSGPLCSHAPLVSQLSHNDNEASRSGRDFINMNFIFFVLTI